MAKAKQQEKETEEFAGIPMDKIPQPKLPRSRGGNTFAGKTFIANPLNGGNPRREGTHGHTLHEMVRAAGTEGIKYEALREQAESEETLVGFLNHIRWDLKRNFILIKEDLVGEGETNVDEAVDEEIAESEAK